MQSVQFTTSTTTVANIALKTPSISEIGILRQLSHDDERTVRYNVDLAAVLFC